MKVRDLSPFLLPSDATLRDAAAAIDRNERGIVIVTDTAGRLLDTITDGDVRRAILAGHDFSVGVASLRGRREHSPYPEPVTALAGTDASLLLERMRAEKLRHVPLLDETGRVVDLAFLEDFVPATALGMRAVVMAGGYGVRLRPLTDELPKPMLPVGGRPLMQHIVEQLREAGVRQVNVTTHFMPEKIREHFGDGRAFGIELNYLNEDTPLGTAGALGLMQRSNEPVLVINGDILTDVDFRAMLQYHREQGAMLTIGTRKVDIQIPYGVVETDGPAVKLIREKPMHTVLVNAGIYVLEPGAHEWVPNDRPFNMTDLVEVLVAAGQPVACFPIHESWLDIGRPEDYQRAQETAPTRRTRSY